MRFIKPLIIVIVALAGSFFLSSAFPVKLPAIEVAAEHIGELPLLGSVTNSLLTTWVVMALLLLLAWGATHRLILVPSGLQNMMEAIVEAVWGLTEDVSGPKRAPKYFPIVATIFLFVLFSNWFGLLPFVGTWGFWEEIKHGAETEAILVPWLRSPSTDLNTTVALALISVTLTQAFGIRAQGIFGYLGKFINVKSTWNLIGALIGRKPRPAKATGYVSMVMFAVIDLYMGILELISEVAKILSFSFRLFGNIFAGEVLLAVIAFLMPYLLPLPFLGLEVFVGFIQAFVFAVLTLVFMTVATIGHGGGEHEASH